MARMKAQEDENQRLKKVLAEEGFKVEVIQEAITKKW